MSVESIMDEARRRHGFRTIAEVARLAESNTIFDVYSTLVATTAMIGRDNVLHPGVIVRADGGDCVLGSGVVLHAGTSIEAVAGGSVVVGDGCVLGPGGVQIRANRGNARIRLGDRVRPVHASVYDHTDGPYDAVYFSASLMLLPDPVAAIAHVIRLLAPGGRLFATQTFYHRRSRFMEWAKPVLRHLTTIEFGKVTYEPEFRAAFAAAGAELVELSIINEARLYSHRLAVAVPAAAPRAA